MSDFQADWIPIISIGVVYVGMILAAAYWAVVVRK